MTATFNRPRLIAASIIGTVAIIAILMLNRFNSSTHPASGGRQPSGTPSEISNLKSQISNAESEISNFKSQISNDPSTDLDRRVAEWVLSIGGPMVIRIKEDGAERDVKDVDELPRGPFKLSVVDLYGNLNVSDDGLEHFRDCKNLTYLSLAYTNTGDVGVANFQDCQYLTGLNLSSTQVTDVGMANFANCPNLMSLSLMRTQVSDEGLAFFKNCSDLKSLTLENTKMQD